MTMGLPRCSESVDSVSGRKEGRGMKHTMMN